jgi:CDP-glucose 4,6-dehydratase
MGGYDPYSSSKGCAELVTSAYRNSFFNIEERTVASVGLASVRAGNVLGGGDWTEDQLVPDIIRAFSDRRPVLIRSPHAVRPWQFVLDPLNGYLRVAEKIWEEGSVFADAWNFGPAESDMKPVSWIADYLAQLWGGEARWIYDGRPRPHEANYLKLDSTKASTLLDWSPKVGLQKTLEWIVEWYKCYRRDGDARPFTEMQLSQYEQAD